MPSTQCSHFRSTLWLRHPCCKPHKALQSLLQTLQKSMLVPSHPETLTPPKLPHQRSLPTVLSLIRLQSLLAELCHKGSVAPRARLLAGQELQEAPVHQVHARRRHAGRIRRAMDRKQRPLRVALRLAQGPRVVARRGVLIEPPLHCPRSGALSFYALRGGAGQGQGQRRQGGPETGADGGR